VAFTGLHGANRLASNSLLEALVYGARVGESLAETELAPLGAQICRYVDLEKGLGVARFVAIADCPKAAELGAQVRRLMWERVGLERSAAGLSLARRELHELRQEVGDGNGELANLFTVAELVTKAALTRTESRGAHFRCDFPKTDPHWQQDLFFEGEHLLAPQPIFKVHAAAG
jgi:L-aspartate oxidase